MRSHGHRDLAGPRGLRHLCLNIDEVKYIFKGKSAHQRSSWDGRNALSAAVHFYSLVDALRPTFRPEASIQGVIPEGGIAPNVVRLGLSSTIHPLPGRSLPRAHVTRMTDAARGAALRPARKSRSRPTAIIAMASR